MNIDGKVLSKILVSQIQQYIKSMTQHDQFWIYSRITGQFNIHKSANVIDNISKKKGKNYMIISMDTEKSFDKLQNPFMTKTHSGYRGNISQHNERCLQPTQYSVVKLKAFVLKSGARQGCSLSPLLFNIALEILTAVGQVKEEKRDPDWKGRGKIALICI